jgi:hypothetical protein
MSRFPRYAPQYSIMINGDSIPAAIRGSVTSITYENALEGADRVQVSLVNQGLRLLDHPLLADKNSLSLALGYAPDPLEQVFTGEIVRIMPTFPGDGSFPTMTIVAQDAIQNLTENSQDKAFHISIPSVGNFPLPDTVVVPLVSATHSLIPLLDPVGSALSVLTHLVAAAVAPQDAQKASTVQRGESDFKLLSRISQRNGWEMYIDHSLEPRGFVIRFRSLFQDLFPVLTLKYGVSLINFEPAFSSLGDVAGVSVRIWVEAIKTELVIILSWDFEDISFKLSVFPNITELSEILGQEQINNTITIKTTGIAQTPYMLLKELIPRLNNRITATGISIGDTRIKAGELVNIEGVGRLFNGLYRITSATHTFNNGGYQTRFDARKEVWFESIPIPQDLPGLFDGN